MLAKGTFACEAFFFSRCSFYALFAKGVTAWHKTARLALVEIVVKLTVDA
jgi:hypothetical protein